tara:strand:+ start:986 stop:1252 length:267 start_codon:yes stop_codon:yes gene_type:complete
MNKTSLQSKTKQSDSKPKVKEHQMNISFRQDEKFLYDWVRKYANTIEGTRSSLVKKMMMRDYQRIEINKGQRIYPIINQKLESTGLSS